MCFWYLCLLYFNRIRIILLTKFWNVFLKSPRHTFTLTISTYNIHGICNKQLVAVHHSKSRILNFLKHRLETGLTRAPEINTVNYPKRNLTHKHSNLLKTRRIIIWTITITSRGSNVGSPKAQSHGRSCAERRKGGLPPNEASSPCL